MDALQTYQVLRECERNEARLCLERLSLLGLFNSFLLLGFFMAVPTTYFCHMRLALPIIGIMASVGLGVALWVGANAVIGWTNALCKIEEEPEFAYMKDRKIRPWIDIAHMKPARRHIWKLGYRVSPFSALLFITMWGICLAML